MDSAPSRAAVSAAVALAAALVLAGMSGCGGEYRDLPVDGETGILNFAKVSDGLYRGGQPDAQGFARLKAMGIRTVVSLRTFNIDRPLLKGLGLEYYHISFKAGHPEDEDVVQFLRIVTTSAHEPVFVHCQWGCDRTGMMVAAYRVLVEGWSRARALDEMRRMGFNDDWHGIEEYVEHLDAPALRRAMATAVPPHMEVLP